MRPPGNVANAIGRTLIPKTNRWILPEGVRDLENNKMATKKKNKKKKKEKKRSKSSSSLSTTFDFRENSRLLRRFTRSSRSPFSIAPQSARNSNE
uniref:Uncharacterized protein n=1 Tax=Caenorhabditis japonica TaxID=281687 RepID=A0A8R1EW00_CAEJA